LAKTREEYADGTQFDSNDSYNFVLGAGKVIRGMELGVSSMKPREVVELRIRSDYAYGPEGYRKSNGDVLVPPFATLLFHAKLQ
jgi:FKBP-type peptidyl-prolyl cis-trans isomerase